MNFKDNTDTEPLRLQIWQGNAPLTVIITMHFDYDGRSTVQEKQDLQGRRVFSMWGHGESGKDLYH